MAISDHIGEDVSQESILQQPDATLTVTIGRNIGDMPMCDKSWDDFRIRVADILHAEVPGGIFFAYEGANFYKSEDGTVVHERSKCYLVLTNGISVNLRRLSDLLAQAALMFGQESIGLSVGIGTLIPATNFQGE
jgi:hypothetical protein